MSYEQGFIIYGNVGDECGPVRLENSSSTLHKVCHKNLACLGTLNHDATFSYQCQKIKKAIGEKCSVYLNECADSLTCIMNEYEVLTCGGASFWRGNIYGSNTNSIAVYETRYYLNTISLILIGFWFLLLLLMFINWYITRKKNPKNSGPTVLFYNMKR